MGLSRKFFLRYCDEDNSDDAQNADDDCRGADENSTNRTCQCPSPAHALACEYSADDRYDTQDEKYYSADQERDDENGQDIRGTKVRRVIAADALEDNGQNKQCQRTDSPQCSGNEIKHAARNGHPSIRAIVRQGFTPNCKLLARLLHTEQFCAKVLIIADKRRQFPDVTARAGQSAQSNIFSD